MQGPGLLVEELRLLIVMGSHEGICVREGQGLVSDSGRPL